MNVVNIGHLSWQSQNRATTAHPTVCPIKKLIDTRTLMSLLAGAGCPYKVGRPYKCAGDPTKNHKQAGRRTAPMTFISDYNPGAGFPTSATAADEARAGCPGRTIGWAMTVHGSMWVNNMIARGRTDTSVVEMRFNSNWLYTLLPSFLSLFCPLTSSFMLNKPIFALFLLTIGTNRLLWVFGHIFTTLNGGWSTGK